MRKIRLYSIVWDNGNASGTFTDIFRTKKEAEGAARRWKREMVAIESTNVGREKAQRIYQWEVEQTTYFIDGRDPHWICLSQEQSFLFYETTRDRLMERLTTFHKIRSK